MLIYSNLYNMKNILVPRTPQDSAHTVAAAIQLRLQQLGWTKLSLTNKGNFSTYTLSRVLHGETIKEKTLQKIILALNHELNSPFQHGTVQELLQWYKDNKTIEAVLQQQYLTEHADMKEKNFEIGQRLKQRRENIGATQKNIGEQLGVSKTSIGHFEQGIFAKQNPTLSAYIKALGWSEGTVEAMDNAPNMPTWAEQLQKSKEIERNRHMVEIDRKRVFGKALHALRESRGLSINGLATQTGCTRANILNLEIGMRHDAQTVAAILKYFRLPDEKTLIDYVRNNQLQKKLCLRQNDSKQFGACVRELRSCFGITAEALSQLTPDSGKVSEMSILALEKPEHEYGTESRDASPEIKASIIAALYLASQEQPRSRQFFEASVDVKRLTKWMQYGHRTAGSQFTQLLDNALDEIITTTHDIADWTDDLHATQMNHPFRRVGRHHNRTNPSASSL